MKGFNPLAPLAIVAAFAALFSCTDNEDPVNPLVGTWENRVFVDSLDIWVVESFEIKNDSVFEQSVTIRQTSDGPNLGYRSITQGIFSQSGDELDLRFTNDFNYRTSLNADVLFVPKAELRQIYVLRIFNSAKVQLISNLEELEYRIICDEPLMGTPPCNEIKSFSRVR